MISAVAPLTEHLCYVCVHRKNTGPCTTMLLLMRMRCPSWTEMWSWTYIRSTRAGCTAPCREPASPACCPPTTWSVATEGGRRCGERERGREREREGGGGGIYTKKKNPPSLVKTNQKSLFWFFLLPDVFSCRRLTSQIWNVINVKSQSQTGFLESWSLVAVNPII